MTYKNDLDIMKLFITKETKIIDENGKTVATLNLPLARDLVERDDISRFAMLIKEETAEKFKKMFDESIKIENSLDLLNNLCCNPLINSFKEFKSLSKDLRDFILRFIKNSKFNEQRVLIIGNEPVTIDLWEEIVVVFRKSIGEKIEPKKTFASKEAEEFYKKAQAAEKRIAEIKGEKENKRDDDWLFKIFLVINDAFPSFSFEKLLNMTFLQVLKLQEYAIKKYLTDIKKMAFANGNLEEMPNLFTQDSK